MRGYNQGTQVQTFEPGDQVLVLLPSKESKLLACWQDQYEVICQTGLVNCEVQQPN